MNRELARYFVKLIAEDLQFSFNGMGLPNNACEWLENQLMQENFDKVEEFIKKRYDEYELYERKTSEDVSYLVVKVGMFVKAVIVLDYSNLALQTVTYFKMVAKALEKSYQEQVINSVNQGKVLKHKKDEKE